jgi:hypothetical protein
VTSKGAVGALAIVAILVLTTAGAHAGGGFGGNVPQTGFFVCHGINGADQGLLVNIETDELGGSTLTNIRVGSGVLGCTYVSVSRADTGAAIEAVPGQFLKCYTIAGSQRPPAPPAGTPTAWTATDAFVPEGETVITSGVRYLCGTGDFHQ